MNKANGINPGKALPRFTLVKLAACVAAAISSSAYAGPEGGSVVGGEGDISHSGTSTTINQSTDRLALEWQSFDIAKNERVNFIQPDSSSVALNRILSNNGTTIQGSIDANGQVILVNPHGIMFGPDSVVNAGGILASGLDIDASDFMNGDFTFRALEGTEASVINQGMLNAATGGSVTLLGKRITNDGLISAELGSLNFAAGREAVVTFGGSGHVGVRVSESLLAEGVGVDPAIVNTGEIRAEGGKVLLTASTSRDIFSQAVNVGEMAYDTSVVIEEDGSFTLGAGADIVNIGSIDVSGESGESGGQAVLLGADIANIGSIDASGESGGQVVLLGENITHKGAIIADGVSEAGHIELHSGQTTLLTGDSRLSASSEEGAGGDIKLLGTHVGVLDHSHVVADGAFGGGQVLVGGDKRGENPHVSNAEATVVGEGTAITADAREDGNGGEIILWADNYLRAYGALSAAGLGTGAGGFIETSADVVDLNPDVRVSGGAGQNGQWLIDPFNITIGGVSSGIDLSGNIFRPSAVGSHVSVQSLLGALESSGNVSIETTSSDGMNSGDEDGDITLAEALNYGGIGAASLELRAHNDINIDANIYDNDPDESNDSLNLTLTANYQNGAQDNGGNITINEGVLISLEGGDFSATGNNFTNNGTINVASADGGGNIDINMNGPVSLGAITLGDLAGGDDDDGPIVFNVSGSRVDVFGDIIYGNDDNNSNQVINAGFSTTAGDIVFDDVVINNQVDGANRLNLSLRSSSDTANFIIRATDNADESGTTIYLTGGSLAVNGGQDFTIGNSIGETAGGNIEFGTQGGDIRIGDEIALAGSFDAAPLLIDNSLDTTVQMHTYSELFGVDLVGDISINVSDDVSLGSMFYEGGSVSTWDYSGSESFTFDITAGGDINVSSAGIPIDRYTGTGTNIISFNAGNAITIAGDISHSANDNSSDNSSMTFTAGAGGFQNSGAIDTNGGALTIGDSDTAWVRLSDDISAGILSIQALGNIEDLEEAFVFATGVTTLTAGASGDIVLDYASTDFDEPVTVVSGRNVTLNDADRLRIGGIVISGNLTLTSLLELEGRDVTEVGGTASFTSTNSSVQFNNEGNNFGGEVSVNARSLDLHDTDSLVLGAIQLSGPTDTNNTNTITAGADITQTTSNITTVGSDITVSATSIQVNDINTSGGDRQNGGDVELTASAMGTGGVTTGTITTTGGSIENPSDNGVSGTNAGDVTIRAPGAISVGAISANGSESADGSGANNNNVSGGDGGNVLLVSSGAGVVASGRIDTRGGNGFASENNDDNDDASGGGGGNVTLTAAAASEISIGGNVLAGGGHRFEARSDSNDVSNGSSGTITLNGDVALTANTELSTALRDPSEDNQGSSEYTPGNVTVNGNVSVASTATSRDFTVNAGVIDMDDIVLAAEDDTTNGGALSLTGSQITVGAMNTSSAGGDGGDITVIVENSGLAELIVTGAINARGAVSDGTVELTLASGATSGRVDLANAGMFESLVTIDGSNSGADILIGQNFESVEVDWVTAASGNGFSYSGEGASSGGASFSGFETLTGGSGVDRFTLGASVGEVNGGAGNDVFTLNVDTGEVNGGAGNDVFTLNVDTGRINGGAGNDTFSILAGITVEDSIVGGDDTDTISLASTTEGEYNWTITGAGEGSLTGGASFTGIETLNGADAPGANDVFTLDVGFGDGNTIDARSGTDVLLVTEAGITEVSFGEAIGGILNLETVRAVLNDERGADDFILELIGNSVANNWLINANNSGRVRNADDTTSDINFENFATLIGNGGNDNFTFTSTGAIRRIDGGGGVDRVDFRGLDSAVHVEILEGELGSIDEDVDADRVRVANAEWLIGGTGNSAAPISNTVTLLSERDHRWEFSDFDGAEGTDADGVRDVVLTRESVSGDDDGNTFNLVDFDIFNSGAGDDTFVIAQADVVATVNGGGGEDTLQGFDAVNTWTMSNESPGNQLTYGAGVVGFQDIENLTGSNAFADTFSFVGAANVTGTIAAGEEEVRDPDALVIDIVDYSATDWSQDITVGSINGVERIIGSNTVGNSLTGSSVFTLWDITGTNSGEVFNADRSDSLQFVNFANIVGSDASDTFALLGGSIVDIDGGGGDGVDQLSGAASGHRWVVSGANTGLVKTALVDTVGAFSAIETLTGADTAADIFEITRNGNFVGTINGGTGAGDTLTVASNTQNTDWMLSATSISVGRGTAANRASLLGFEELQGGSGVDIFRVQDGFANADLVIDGTASGDGDILDVVGLSDTGTTAFTLSVGAENNALSLSQNLTNIVTVRNVERARGASQSNLSLQSSVASGAGQAANTWQVEAIDGTDGINDGTLRVALTSGERVVEFENIAHLRGSAGTDAFSIEDGGSFAGTIDGVSGTDDSLVYRAANLTWQLGEDAFSGAVAGLTFQNIHSLTGNASDSILIGRNQNNLWSVTGANQGTVAQDVATPSDELRFFGFSSLSGNSMQDSFVLDTIGSISGTIQGTLDGVIDNGDDSLSVASAANGVLNWTINSDGSAAGRVAQFSRIETITGGAGSDVFSIEGVDRATVINGAPIGTAPGDDSINWNVGGSGADFLISDSVQRVRVRGDVSAPEITFNFINSVSGSDTEGDLFALSGGSVPRVYGRGGADRFEIDSSVNPTINISVDGGGASDTLVGANRDNQWFIGGSGEGDNTLNYQDASNSGVVFQNIEAFEGNSGSDIFVVREGASVESINGGAQTNDSNDRLEVERSATGGGETRWSISGANAGRVDGQITSFTNIEHLLGGLGADIVTFETGGSISGLIDGGDNEGTDSIIDRLDVRVFSQVVVEVNPVAVPGTVVVNTETFANVNAWGFEEYVAADRTPDSAENNQWITLGTENRTLWDLEQFNRGTVVEQSVAMVNGTEVYTPIEGTRFSFLNFGSAQDGSGDQEINSPETNLTGIWNPAGGRGTLIYDENSGFVVVDITPLIAEVRGNGTTFLRILPTANSAVDADYNGANIWDINGDNSGVFTADYLSETFSFSFSGVNQIQGGAGNDTYNFNGGRLIDGLIASGGGIDRVIIDALQTQDLSFGVSRFMTDTVTPDTRFPNDSSVPVFVAETRSEVINLVGITQLQGSSAATAQVGLISGYAGEVFDWRFDGQGSGELTNSTNNTILSFSDVNLIAGGAADDTFNLSPAAALGYRLDGGGGMDTVDLRALDDVIVALGDTADVYANIEAFVGNNSNSVIQGADAINIWTIDGINQGEVVYNALSVSFSGFTQVLGGAIRDEFNVEAGTISNGIFGRGGNDELNVALGFADTGAGAPGSGGATGDLRFVGGEGENTVNFTGGSATTRFEGEYTANVLPAPVSQTFRYSISQPTATQTTRIALEEVSGIDDQVYTNTFVINDIAAQADVISVGANRFSVGELPQVSSQNNRSLSVDAESQDQLVIDGTVRLDGRFRVTNAAVVNGDATSRIVAGEAVQLAATNSVGSVDDRLVIETGELFLDGLLGDTFIEATGDIDLAQLNGSAGLVDIAASGSISGSGALSSVNDIRLTSDGSILLNSDNRLSGILNLSAQDDISLTNGLTRLGQVQAQNLTIDTQSNVEDNGAIAIANTTTINAAATSAVVLDGEENQFNDVSVNSAGSVLLVDSSDDGLSVGGSAAAAFTVRAIETIIANAIGADAISLSSTNAALTTQAALTASSSVALSGSGVTVNDTITVSSGNVNTAIDIDAGQGQAAINASLLVTGNTDGNIEVDGAGINQAAGAELRGRDVDLISTADITLAADITASGDLTIEAEQGAITMTNGVAATRTEGQEVVLTARDNILTRGIVADTLQITSSAGNITQQGDITTTTAELSALAGEYVSQTSTTLTLQAGESTLNARTAQLDGDIAGNGTLTMNVAQNMVQNGDITAAGFTAIVGGEIVMATGSRIQTTGDVNMEAGGNIALAAVNAQGANVVLTSGGAIVDNNAEAVNVSAESLVARSEEGFGGGGDSTAATESINTAVANIDVLNNTGGLGVMNDGDLAVTALISNSDVYLHNANGNVTMVNDLDRVYDLSTTDARIAGGVINANYEFGVLTATIPNGYLTATGEPFYQRPELVGDFVNVTTSGGFGVDGRRLVVYVRTRPVVGGRGIQPLWGFNRPPLLPIVTDTDLLDASSKTSISELLIEVEDLQDVNPAVFTDVRNYALDNSSIRMPRDQIYDNDIYDDERDEEIF